MTEKLKTYFSFAKKMRCYYYGEKLLEACEKKRIHLIVISPYCPLKIKEKYQKFAIPILDCTDFSQLFDKEKINALGIADSNLAKAMIKEIREEKNE